LTDLRPKARSGDGNGEAKLRRFLRKNGKSQVIAREGMEKAAAEEPPVATSRRMVAKELVPLIHSSANPQLLDCRAVAQRVRMGVAAPQT
jgi:hypothetical protein